MSKDRLAKPGYYISWYGLPDDIRQGFGVCHISTQLKCKYIHWSWGTNWHTLMWVAAPTQKAIDISRGLSDSEHGERYLYFETHKDLLSFELIKQKPGALIPSPLDDHK